MKWYSWLICIALIITGCLSCIFMVEIWSETSAVYGSVSSIETQSDYELVAKFDCGVIAFETEDNSTYTNTSTFDPMKFNGTSGDYVLLFNDNIVSDVEFYSGKVVATIYLNFYSTSGEVASTATFNVVIEFLSDSTTISVSTKNSNSSIAYLERYMTVNGVCLKIVERGV